MTETKKRGGWRRPDLVSKPRTDLGDAFADEVRRAMDETGKSRYTLSQELGVAESTLSRFYNGKQGISLALFARLLDLVGCKLVRKGK